MTNESFILNENETVDVPALLTLIIDDLNAFTLNSFFKSKEIIEDFRTLKGAEFYYSDNNTLKVSKEKNGDFLIDFSGEGMFLKLQFKKNGLAENGIIQYTNDNDQHAIVKSNLEGIQGLIHSVETTDKVEQSIISDKEKLKVPVSNPPKDNLDLTPRETLDVIKKLESQNQSDKTVKKPLPKVSIRRVFLRYRNSYYVELSNRNVVHLNLEQTHKRLVNKITIASNFKIINNAKELQIENQIITVDSILKKAKEVPYNEYKTFTQILGGTRMDATQVGFHFAPFGDNEFIGISEFSGYGSQESGGYNFYNTEQIRNNESVKKIIEECDGKWLLDLIQKKASQKEIRDAISAKLNYKP